MLNLVSAVYGRWHKYTVVYNVHLLEEYCTVLYVRSVKLLNNFQAPAAVSLHFQGVLPRYVKHLYCRYNLYVNLYYYYY